MGDTKEGHDGRERKCKAWYVKSVIHIHFYERGR